MKLAALMGCCLSTGIGTVFNQAKMSKYDSPLVVGCGGSWLIYNYRSQIKKKKKSQQLTLKILI